MLHHLVQQTKWCPEVVLQNLEMPVLEELEWNHCHVLLSPVIISETNKMTQSEKQSSLQSPSAAKTVERIDGSPIAAVVPTS